ncbi:hypothetical protein VNO77_23507 [Canavalia gladiata]|uniref:Uncharacterized protein n=1 Tax=Canavalia gladiata TaxID=3824 RepID=A0AAN9L708_CANGL
MGRVGVKFHIPRPRYPVPFSIPVFVLVPVPVEFNILNPILVLARVRGNPPRTRFRFCRRSGENEWTQFLNSCSLQTAKSRGPKQAVTKASTP